MDTSPALGLPRHERWAKETDLVEKRHAAEVMNAKARAEERVAAYRAAAEAASADGDRAEDELTVERVGHLATLEALNKAKRAHADVEKHASARVGELLAEVADLREANDDLDRQLIAGQEKRATSGQRLLPISVVFHSFRLIFRRAIIYRNGLDAWLCLRVRNTHVEATSKNPFPAQAHRRAEEVRRRRCQAVRARRQARGGRRQGQGPAREQLRRPHDRRRDGAALHRDRRQARAPRPPTDGSASDRVPDPDRRAAPPPRRRLTTRRAPRGKGRRASIDRSTRPTVDPSGRRGAPSPAQASRTSRRRRPSSSRRATPART